VGVVCARDATCALFVRCLCHVCEPYGEDIAARVLQRKREVPVEADLRLQGSSPMVQHDHSRPLTFAPAPTSPSGTTALAGTAKWDQREDRPRRLRSTPARVATGRATARRRFSA
jgi:hypothetical protein